MEFAFIFQGSLQQHCFNKGCHMQIRRIKRFLNIQKIYIFSTCYHSVYSMNSFDRCLYLRCVVYVVFVLEEKGGGLGVILLGSNV